ncbi:hypothetical protein NOVOSPHI9U_70106 [Novosphingobium sp. 9U]|nr:hypothetical protein NOVOSPHI9U_70106 [Novosphingobium sp. 9U]
MCSHGSYLYNQRQLPAPPVTFRSARHPNLFRGPSHLIDPYCKQQTDRSPYASDVGPSGTMDPETSSG